MMYDRKTTKVDNAEMARLYGLRYGYNDPAARMFRKRARWDRIRETCAEVGVILLWGAGAWLWIWATWTFE